MVAIIGPPNSGKSTLFNRLTGLRQKVANFPGVTVEHRIGKARTTEPDREVILVDLPGVYSLDPRSEDERSRTTCWPATMQGMPKPDAVLLILDSTNLGRHLVLAAPILSLRLPTLVILNMADDLASRGGEVDAAELASATRRARGSDQRVQRRGRRKGFPVPGRHRRWTASQAPLAVELPVLQDIPQVPRAGPRNVGAKARLSCARAAALDAPAGCGLPASRGRAAGFPAGRRAAVFQTIFAGAKPLMDGLQTLIQNSGAWDRRAAAAFHLPLAGGRWRLERRRRR